MCHIQNNFNAPLPAALPDIDSPLHLAAQDTALAIQNSWLLAVVLWPFWPFLPNNQFDELDLRRWSNIVSISRQVFLLFFAIVVFALSGCILFFGVFAFIPPLGFLLGAIITSLLIVASLLLTTSTTYSSKNGKKFPRESWLFVNGVCTDRGWLGLNCEMLAETFGRSILGIHNRTFGPVFDRLKGIILRAFGYTTDEVRQLYAVTKQELLDEDNRRVVLIGHSQVRISAVFESSFMSGPLDCMSIIFIFYSIHLPQGGTIISTVVDRLLSTLGEGHLRKLEVYTFGCAANHMQGDKVLKCIEHFANKYDFVARTGVMAYHPSVMPGNKYDGTLYIDLVSTGHLLNMHYLRTMFADERPVTDFAGGGPPTDFPGGGPPIGSHMAGYLGGGRPVTDFPGGRPPTFAGGHKTKSH